MAVRRYDYAAQFGDDLEAVVGSIRRILTRGNYDRSEEAETFEKLFASYTHTEYARTVGCGTDALILTLRTLGIGPGDEVITQANTFHATVAAIAMAGALPVLVDVDEETFLMRPDAVEAAVTQRTRAVIPVHLYGKPSPMYELAKIAQRHSLMIIEDAAQAHGARLGGKPVGSFGVAGCFSFHPSKNLAAAGDAGCVVTNSHDVAKGIEAHRTHGQLVQHEHLFVGVNSKIDALQATVLLSKLPKLDDWNKRRRELAQGYRDRLAGLDISFQRQDADEEHVYHLFQLRTMRRNELLDYLVRRGIEATVRYPYPIHMQPAFKHYGWTKGEFPVSERLAAELLCLPLRPDMSEAELDETAAAVHSCFEAAVA